MTYNVQPAIDAVPLGTSADVRAIPASPVSGTGQASQSDLFPAETSQPVASGGLPPSRLDFNALFKLLGASTYFIQHGGVFGYDATLNYDKGALVRYDDTLYMAVAANGTGETVGAVTPGTDADVWLELGGSEGPWATDRDFRLTDYDAAHSTATYQLNQGDTAFVVTLPTALDVQTLASGTGTPSGVSYEIKRAGNAYHISVTGVASAISADNPSAVLDGLTGLTATRHVTSNIGTQQYAQLRTGATVPAGSGITAGAQVLVETVYERGGGESGTGIYSTETRIASDGIHCTSMGDVPTAWDDSSVSITPNGLNVSCPIVNHAFPAMTPAGIYLQGFNTVGSTILACRSIETSAAVNHYGNLVSGSELRWAALDTDGGQLAMGNDGDLQLTGTWVKLSGQSIKYYGTWGMGLYRRIL